MLPFLVAALLSAPPPIEPSPKPVSNPAHARPYFSWDTVPLAFHGANRTGLYNAATVATLAKYQMVTIEKWYTACGGEHPKQAGPECDVEASMYQTFGEIKAINPNTTIIMYFNSMMDFTMYNMAAKVDELEAAGTRILLRDANDDMVILCNDGNYYCDVKFYDWSKEAARNLWTQHVINATKIGHVQGIFADHATQMLVSPDPDSGALPQICNGKAPLRKCYSFTNEFADAFNAGHSWLVNHTQDMLAAIGGPVVDGPYSSYNEDVCNFNTFRQHVQEKNANAHGPYVMEASKGGCTPDDSCIASYLLAAVEFTYLGCLADEPTLPSYANLSKPLGPPLGDAELVDNVWTRTFRHGAVARWYPAPIDKGTMQWPGDPTPPIPPGPRPPLPPQKVQKECGKLLVDTTIAYDDVGVSNAADSQGCCNLCSQTATCVQWAWHGDVGPPFACHLHGSNSTVGKVGARKNCFSGVMQK